MNDIINIASKWKDCVTGEPLPLHNKNKSRKFVFMPLPKKFGSSTLYGELNLSGEIGMFGYQGAPLSGTDVYDVHKELIAMNGGIALLGEDFDPRHLYDTTIYFDTSGHFYAVPEKQKTLSRFNVFEIYDVEAHPEIESMSFIDMLRCKYPNLQFFELKLTTIQNVCYEDCVYPIV